MELTSAEIISIVSMLVAIIAVTISFFNLREMKQVRIESVRANINVSFSYIKEISSWEIVIKNFGNSSGVLKNIIVNPALDTTKILTASNHEFRPLTEITNLFLAPGQQVSARFPFEDYPDKEFDITLCYKTLGKVYTENYKIDLAFYDNIGYVIFSDRKSNASLEDLLGEISTNIAWLSRKF